MSVGINELCSRFPELNAAAIRAAFGRMLASVRQGGKILVCGNGGSAADAEHIVGELMKGFLLDRALDAKARADFERFGDEGARVAARLQGGIPAICLNSQMALISAIGNDVGYDMAFAQQVYGYGRPGDVLIALTTSGNACNVKHAALTAKALGMCVIGITGEGGGVLGPLCDVHLAMPSSETYRVQEYTLPVYHALCAMLEWALYGNESDGEDLP